jgi:hypothetical protein
MTPWEIQADEFVTCNCDYGCPCQFNALPTNGDCQAVAGFTIKTGKFGDVSLDGLRAVGIMRWPGAIHEGNGEALIIVDERATEEQRGALMTILTGQETDPFATMWNVFASTMVTVHDPVFTAIDIGVDVEGRIGHVKVDGLVETSGEPIKNPMSGVKNIAPASIWSAASSMKWPRWAAAQHAPRGRSNSRGTVPTASSPTST